jgi:CubicO group peptidase (beta-lactamase class C family)
MMLYEEGHFLLSDPICKWLPEFANPMVATSVSPREYTGTPWKLVPAKRPITIRHLLTHTAGLQNTYRPPRGITQQEFTKIIERRKPEETIGDFVQRYATAPLSFHPGEAWDYSRATCIIGHLVEIISGKTLDDFFRSQIFQPLHMQDTHFYVPQNKVDRFAASYTPGTDKQIQLADPASSESRFVKKPHTYFMGSGGLVSTAADYFRFNQMLLNKGTLNGTRILSRKTVELMTRNHTGDLPVWLRGLGAGFGLGFAVIRNTDHVNSLKTTHKGPNPWSVGTYLWGGAYCTLAWVDPREQLIGVFMTQVRPYTHLNIRHDIVGLTYQAIID